LLYNRGDRHPPKTPMTVPRADLDSPWKNILRAYFPQAIAFFFPQTAALIDWSRPYELLDKEFQQIARDAEFGKRYADQLFKVWQVDGAELWLLVHVEVQAQKEKAFAQRMFTYSIRIFDRYQQIPISLAILCDESDQWRPHEYGVNYPNTRLSFEFGTVKLIDYKTRWAELERSENPFATVVMAHLKVLETRRNVDLRKAWKFTLTKALYEKGYGRQEILDLYRFIDWVMILPEAAERSFWQELQAFEEERKVTYVTNAERFGIEKGIEQGIKQGIEQGIERERSLILRQLTRKIGTITPNIEAQIATLSVSQLESLGEALLDFAGSADLDKWLKSHQP
jgi:Domain of unknown function (DUF4351)